jgi:hypothetical protein
MGKAMAEPPPSFTLERVSETSDEPPPPTYHIHARSDQNDVRTSPPTPPPNTPAPVTLPKTTLAGDPAPPSFPAAAQDYKGKREYFADEQVPWKNPWPEYAPRSFTHHSVLANASDKPDGQKWADPADPSLMRKELEARITYVNPDSPDSDGGSPPSPPSPPLPPAFAVGDHVRHKDRGVGIVAELLSDGRMPVIFEGGEMHRYKPSSLHKFDLVEKAAVQIGSLSRLELGESGGGGGGGGGDRRRSVAFGGGLPLAQVTNPYP